jgi:hypothetical protein
MIAATLEEEDSFGPFIAVAGVCLRPLWEIGFASC